jgi:hypothetical protein
MRIIKLSPKDVDFPNRESVDERCKAEDSHRRSEAVEKNTVIGVSTLLKLSVPNILNS